MAHFCLARNSPRRLFYAHTIARTTRLLIQSGPGKLCRFLGHVGRSILREPFIFIRHPRVEYGGTKAESAFRARTLALILHLRSPLHSHCGDRDS
jgi:hypothetical protein